MLVFCFDIVLWSQAKLVSVMVYLRVRHVLESVVHSDHAKCHCMMENVKIFKESIQVIDWDHDGTQRAA